MRAGWAWTTAAVPRPRWPAWRSRPTAATACACWPPASATTSEAAGLSMDLFASQQAQLSALFAPRAIAVVGASSSVHKIGGIPLDYQRRFGFDGALYPVNPNADRIQNLPAWPSLRAIGQPVDLAILAVPSALVEGALDDAIAAGVQGVVLFSSGFAETGAAGAAAQARLGDKARAAGVRLIGPNCLGFMNLARHVYATFTPAPNAGRVAAGRIGLVSQSGAFGAYAYAMA